jgi:hypothetical protein|tara:strand:- start:588 stop:1457 length:870 start_codon:yes stop_codon:yes gene_type:complete
MGNTEVVNLSEDMDKIVDAFNSDDTDALMEASGQGTKAGQTGLPRLNINYDQENEEGVQLKRGTWRMYLDGRSLYADTVYITPILRTFEYSLWDSELGEFSCKSVQKPTLQGEFPDNSGTNKCGRLSRDEEESLSQTDEKLIHSRSVNCNQIIYGTIHGDFKTADGEEVKIDKSSEQPVVFYSKRSSFKPISDFIAGLTRQNKIMQKCVIRLVTDKRKRGSVNYWVPVPTFHADSEITDKTKELMGAFAHTVKGHNDNIMYQYKSNVKLQDSNQADDELADRFKNAITA